MIIEITQRVQERNKLVDLLHQLDRTAWAERRDLETKLTWVNRRIIKLATLIYGGNNVS